MITIHFYFKEIIKKAPVPIDQLWMWNQNEGEIINQIPVQLNGQLYQSNQNVELKAKLSLELPCNCSRCIKPFMLPLKIEVHEIFTRELEGKDSFEPHIHLVDTEQVQLDSYFEENIILGLPYIPVCDVNCKGLCMHCGIDFNIHTCSCLTNQVDSRLEKLADFFKDT